MLIKDLSKDLDAEGLAAVRGGNNGNAATNTIGQQMAINVPVAVLAGGPANTNVNVTGTQSADITNDQRAGDAFAVLFPFDFGRMTLR
jgi:hypothetical protein